MGFSQSLYTVKYDRADGITDHRLNTLKPKENGRNFVDILLSWMNMIEFRIALKFALLTMN